MAVTASTAGDIITHVRFIIGDVYGDSYRWVNTELFLWLTDAQREIIRIRPDAYVDGSGLQHTSVTIPLAAALAATSTKLNIHPFFDDALINYVAFRALSKNLVPPLSDPSLPGRYFDRFKEVLTRKM